MFGFILIIAYTCYMNKEIRQILLHPLNLFIWSLVFLVGSLFILMLFDAVATLIFLIFSASLLLVSIAKILQSMYHFAFDRSNGLSVSIKLTLMLLPIVLLGLELVLFFSYGAG